MENKEIADLLNIIGEQIVLMMKANNILLQDNLRLMKELENEKRKTQKNDN